jgi:cytochrome c556
MRNLTVLCAVFLAGFTVMQTSSAAQTPPLQTVPPQAVGVLKQVMKSILLPTSDAIFATQSELPKTPTEWEAVEDDAIALAEAANLLTIRGRMCSSGLPVPVDRPDFMKATNGLRDAAQVTLKALQSKDQEQIIDASGVLTDACSACHDVYREVPVRCTVK